MKTILISALAVFALASCGGGGNEFLKNVEKSIDVDLMPAYFSLDHGTKSVFYYAAPSGDIAIELDEIPGKISSHGPFVDGLAIIQTRDNGAFIIDKTGKIVFDLNELEAKPVFGAFSDGIAIVCAHGEYFAIDTEGKRLFDIPGKPYTNLMNGYAIYEEDGKKGVINRKGEIVLSPGEVEIWQFAQPRTDMVVLFGNDSGLYDLKTGKRYLEGMDLTSRIPKSRLSILDYNDCVIIRGDDGMWCIMDLNGEVLAETDFQELFNDGEWYKGINSDGLLCWIDKKGNVMIEPEYEISSREFREIGFGSGDYCYIPSAKVCIDRKGNVVFEGDYGAMTPYINGKALAKVGRNAYCWIDAEGNMIGEAFTPDSECIYPLQLVTLGYSPAFY